MHRTVCLAINLHLCRPLVYKPVYLPICPKEAGILGSMSLPATLTLALTKQLVEEALKKVKRDELICPLRIFLYINAETTIYKHSLSMLESIIRDRLLTSPTVLHSDQADGYPPCYSPSF